MKKSFSIGLIGLACGVTASFGQGVILLDNYTTSGPLVTYGSTGIPANGSSGNLGTVGTGLLGGWTLGFYYVVGNVTGSIPFDPTGSGIPGGGLGGLTLASGAGSTAAFYTSSFSTPGTAFAGTIFTVPGTSVAGGDIITVEAVAYSGSSYNNSTFRAHSTAFTMTTSANNSVSPSQIGASMPAFAIVVPEPSILALSAVGGFALIYFRRGK